MKKRAFSLVLTMVMLVSIFAAQGVLPAQAASITPSFPLKGNTAAMTAITYGSPNYNYTYASSKARYDQYGTDWWGGHHGTDYFALDLSGSGATKGTPVYAVADGVVVFSWATYGQIVIKHTVPITLSDGKTTYNTWYSNYVHMQNVSVKNGSTVSQNQQIGQLGATGTSAAHLHFSLSTSMHQGKSFHYYDNKNADLTTSTTPTYDRVMGYAFDTLNPRWVFPNHTLNVKSQYTPDAMDKEAIARFNLSTEYAPGNPKNGTQYGGPATTVTDPYYSAISHEGITTDNAKIKATCQNPSKIRLTTGGFYFSSKPGAVANGQKLTDNIPASYQTVATIPCGYDLKNEYGLTLTPGQTYYYVLYVAESSGKTYYSQEYSFTTVCHHNGGKTVLPAVAATCTATGLTAGEKCSDCGTVLVAQKVTDKLAHDQKVTVKGTAATCGKDGKTDGKKCSMCGTVTVKQNTIPATGKHTYDNAQDEKCNVCGYVRQVTVPSVPMYRMYDPNSSEHFYTGSTVERDNLVAAGWNYEGVGFNFPKAGSPVHRLYESKTGEHLYTMNEKEKESLLKQGWNYEGVAFNSAGTDEIPQYRLHNPNATRGAYHFTGATEERDHLISLGWEYQGIGWYSCLK